MTKESTVSSAVPHRLTDCFWLAAYDNVNGKPRIDEISLGLGLGAGLLAELVENGFLELRDGMLYRATADLPDDLALRPLMITMAAEEDGWSSLPIPVPATSDTTRHGGNGWAPERHTWQQPVGRNGWDSQPQEPASHARQPPRQDRPRSHLRAPQRTRARTGHLLDNWLSFLAYERFAERRVIERLVLAGLSRQQEHRRWLRRPVTRVLPNNSVVAGTPANRISTGVQRRRELSRTDLLLAGLLLATGLHKHALATLSQDELSELNDSIHRGVDETSLELLNAVHTAVGDAAMRRR
jgi:hypothetical protein